MKLPRETTAYDSMKIPRGKGKRREVRLILAQRSHELPDRYRRGEAVEECPLKKALTGKYPVTNAPGCAQHENNAKSSSPRRK
ncbi:MAG: hypothetical protein ABSG53_22320 [Thermoguttaceae bacterium]